MFYILYFGNKNKSNQRVCSHNTGLCHFKEFLVNNFSMLNDEKMCRKVKAGRELSELRYVGS